MSWRDRLRKASFRGATFHVQSHELTEGRRGQTHEYPQRDEPYAEDAGGSAKKFSFDGYVVDANYDRLRDDLLEALRKRGPGTLVHPYLGTHQVQARAWTLRESASEGRVAHFALHFDEAGRNRFPDVSIDTGQVLRDAGDVALEVLKDAFEAVFDAAAPDFLADAAAGTVELAADALDLRASNLKGAQSTLGSFRRAVSNLRLNARNLVGSPPDLAGDMTALVRSLALLPSDARTGFDAVLGLGGFSSGLSHSNLTATQVRNARNDAVLSGLVRRAAAIEAARLLPSVSFTSRDDAVAVREQLGGLIDSEITVAGSTGEDDVFRELSDLYAAVALDLRERGASLAQVRRITLPGTVPAAVIAHRLYQDATRDQEIVDRNHVRWPGFVPGGVALEVLTDA